MNEHKDIFTIKAMARVLDVSRSGYYAWRYRPKSKRAVENELLLKEIAKSFQDSCCNYGSPRIYRDIKEQGLACGRNRIARLMRYNGLVARSQRRYKRSSKTAHGRACFEHLLNRNFRVHQPNRVWAADITTLWTGSGWLHIAVVMDLFSRKIIGWSMHSRITDDLSVNALTMAISARKLQGPIMHHSDQGSQYQSFRLKHVLDANRITGSMSRTGECYDNAVIESFFKTLKYEWTKHTRYRTREEAKTSIFEFIEIYYNKQRRHSTIGFMSPERFEKEHLAETGVH